MSYLIEIDKSYEIYFKKMFKELKFVEYNMLDQGVGALRDYKNDKLKLRILNDRGILSFEISKAFGKESFIDFNWLMLKFIAINSADITNSKLDIFQKAKRDRHLYSLEEQAKFFEENYDSLENKFSFWKYRKTYRALR